MAEITRWRGNHAWLRFWVSWCSTYWQDLDFIHCFHQQKRSASFHRIYLLRLLPIASSDFSERDFNCDVPTIHITSNCSSRYLIWIWDRLPAHTRSVHWDQLAILGVGKTAAIEKVHGKFGRRLIDNCRSCLLVSFPNLILGCPPTGEWDMVVTMSDHKNGVLSLCPGKSCPFGCRSENDGQPSTEENIKCFTGFRSLQWLGAFYCPDPTILISAFRMAMLSTWAVIAQVRIEHWSIDRKLTCIWYTWLIPMPVWSI